MGFFGIIKPNVDKLIEKEDVNGLMKALKFRDSNIRRSAAQALGAIGDMRATEPLEAAKKDSDPSVSQAASSALEKVAWAEFKRGLDAFGPELRDTAEAHFRRAIQLKPDEGVFHSRLAATLEAKGQRDEAIGCYEEAMRLAPGDGSPHFFMGNMMRDLGRLATARRYYLKALALALHEKLRPICDDALQLLPEDVSDNASPSPQDLKRMIQGLAELNSKAVASTTLLSMGGTGIGAVMMLGNVLQMFENEICPAFNEYLQEAKEMFWFDPSVQGISNAALDLPKRSLGAKEGMEICARIIPQIRNLAQMLEAKCAAVESSK